MMSHTSPPIQPLKEITHDWHGEPVRIQTSYSLTYHNGAILFTARCEESPWYDAAIACGDFREGLWQMDAAEFFLKEEWNGTVSRIQPCSHRRLVDRRILIVS